MEEPTHERNLVMIRLSVVSGVRSLELVSPKHKHFDFKRGRVGFRGAKTHKWEYAPFDAQTGAFVRALWRRHHVYRNPGVWELFIGI